MKKLYKSGEDFHFGGVKMEEFSEVSKGEVEQALANLGKRRLWRCNVCNDLYVGENPPKICPTCLTEDAYIEINEKEFMEMIK